MPISLPLLDSLTNLANAYAESSPVHNQMAAVRQEIGSIMNKYCQKSLDENNVSYLTYSVSASFLIMSSLLSIFSSIYEFTLLPFYAKRYTWTCIIIMTHLRPIKL